VDQAVSRRALIAGTAGTLLLGGLSFNRTQNPAERVHNLPVVTCTIGMITDVVRNIGGDAFSISGLMGPGIDPHLYKPSAGDIVRLGDADLVLFNGLHLEGRLTETLEDIHSMGNVRTRAIAESVPEELRFRDEEDSDAWDPHVWMDISLWTIVAEAIGEELILLTPDNTDAINERSTAYRRRMAELEGWVFSEFARVPKEIRVLITAHDAFNYFGHRYEVEVLGLQGLSTATEAGAADVQSLAQMLADRRIPAIFVESSIPPSTIEAVQAASRSRGWDVQIGGELYSDAMGASGTPEGTYIGMVRHNVSTIVEALLGAE
jgi:manganese/zinc/iron transport system substrate-binding protein